MKKTNASQLARNKRCYHRLARADKLPPSHLHPSNNLKQNSIRTVPEQYQTTPKTDLKTRPNPTSNEKTKRNTHTMGRRGGVGARVRLAPVKPSPPSLTVILTMTYLIREHLAKTQRAL